MRETLTVNLAAERQLFAAMDTADPKYPAAAARIQRLTEALPPKRDRVRRPVDGRPAMPLERDIQRACLELLRQHPKVAYCWRANSGTFTEQNQDGSMRYISANSAPGCPDILGYLKGGRFMALEVKRPGQKPTRLQEQFLDRARQAGALAEVITDPQQIVDLLQ
jgi:hypothetical protein